MVFEKVKDVVAKNIGVNADDLKMETSFEELNVDSLDLFQIIIDLEEEFNIKIEDAESIKTIKDAVDFINNSVSK